jgi:hypothetical protein
MFRFAEKGVSEKFLTEAGFLDPETSIIQLSWCPTKPEHILEMIYKSVVRMPMILEAQTRQARDLINQEIIKLGEGLQNGDVIEIKFPALVATARKA